MTFTKKAPLTLDQQVANYRRQFELYALLRDDLDALEKSMPRSTQRWELIEKINRLAIKNGWDGSRWTWDEEWDGKLIDRCYGLQSVGFTVTKFYRKQKIQLNLPKPWPDRHTLMEMILEGAGDEWAGVAFRPSIAVWWQSTSRTFGNRR